MLRMICLAIAATALGSATAIAGDGAGAQTAIEKPLAAGTLEEFLTGDQKFHGRPISLQFKDADVRDVINLIAEETGANIVMTDDVRGRISLKLRRVPWDQALVTIMRSNGLGYVRQGNILQITPLKTLEAESEAALRRRDK